MSTVLTPTRTRDYLTAHRLVTATAAELPIGLAYLLGILLDGLGTVLDGASDDPRAAGLGGLVYREADLTEAFTRYLAALAKVDPEFLDDSVAELLAPRTVFVSEPVRAL